jgi:hypothetical protein
VEPVHRPNQEKLPLAKIPKFMLLVNFMVLSRLMVVNKLPLQKVEPMIFLQSNLIRRELQYGPIKEVTEKMKN